VIIRIFAETCSVKEAGFAYLWNMKNHYEFMFLNLNLYVKC
jgi:hypothetical protein